LRFYLYVALQDGVLSYPASVRRLEVPAILVANLERRPFQEGGVPLGWGWDMF
jgi:hypothetical protein